MSENIYEALRASHELQRTLCRKMLRASPKGDNRKALAKELAEELAAHAAAEERFLYAPILMNDMGLDPSRHALSEHHKIDEAVEKLSSLDPSGEAWLNHAKELSKLVHHHLKEEEKKFFQISGKILSDTQKTRLATQYRKDYQRMHHVLASK
ncbi:hemerythrin domain-containing protein [Oxalicibacterium faecigallinarum]|uniref:Hemerythrin n=1 Tax=Oxalicibacterium faecigallinarum TaxID=573741 RepID=A0A8J3F449_9BURK|nr:hemerythrin domain-containing protein [Oxalicibacterium faecigallinarum]GGI21642.1 hemerythrin [Oxalicibacterium faecigallinarum]